jgi:hypothetical protein
MMLKRLLGGLLAAALFSGINTAQAACTVRNSFTAGTTAFASLVNQDFTDLINCVLTLSGSGVITSTGSVGIGTTNPAALLNLSVVGGDGSGQFRITSGGAPANYWEMGRDNNTTGDLRFISTGSEKVRFTATGNVGIGTTNPAALLNLSPVGGDGSGQFRIANGGAPANYWEMGRDNNTTGDLRFILPVRRRFVSLPRATSASGPRARVRNSPSVQLLVSPTIPTTISVPVKLQSVPLCTHMGHCVQAMVRVIVPVERLVQSAP